MKTRMKNRIGSERGQTIIELVLMLPLLFTFTVILYKVTMAIQVAINNAQYARSQIYVLTSNSPEYPRLQLRRIKGMFLDGKQDRMLLGVADIDTSPDKDQVDPIAPKMNIARSKTTASGSNDPGEVKKRNKVRVRNTMAICTQLNFVPSTKNERWPFGNTVCRYEGMI